MVVGVVVSQTGPHAEPAEGYRRGLLVWQDEVNAAGGLLGRKVDLRILDDASSAPRNASLYEQLIRQDRADLLIGPFGTAATLVAAATAERARRVLINGAGPGARGAPARAALHFPDRHSLRRVRPGAAPAAARRRA